MPSGSRLARRALWCGVVAALTLLVLVLALLSFSIGIEGRSMTPTLHSGDRLMVNFLARHDIHRFDLVEAHMAGTSVVKRVIGLPGDRVIVTAGQAATTVRIRPAGSDSSFVVSSPEWDSQRGEVAQSCCEPDGRSSTLPVEVTVPSGHYWLIGDDWAESKDSRAFGFVAAAQISARLNFRVWPVNRFGSVPNHVRLTRENSSAH